MLRSRWWRVGSFNPPRAVARAERRATSPPNSSDPCRYARSLRSGSVCFTDAATHTVESCVMGMSTVPDQLASTLTLPSQHRSTDLFQSFR